jgi:hypothetical protein
MFVKDDGKIVFLILYRCLLKAASLIPLKRRRSLQYSTNNNYVNRQTEEKKYANLPNDIYLIAHKQK